MTHKLLRNSTEIKRQLSQMFCRETRGRRRVIVVAYVGKEAPRLLPDYSEVELYCWPQVGATNPYAIIELLKLKPRPPIIYFVDRLHMKIYWVERVGYVIASANLSDNALDEDGLHEFGIFSSDSQELQVDELIDSLHCRKPTESELDKLTGEHEHYQRRNAKRRMRAKNLHQGRLVTFDKWHSDQHRRTWKLGIYQTGYDTKHQNDIMNKYPNVEVDFYIGCNKSEYVKGDWVLIGKISNGSLDTKSIAWLFVDKVAPDKFAKKGDCKYLAIQEKNISYRPRKPFKLDKKFKQSLKSIIRTIDKDKEDVQNMNKLDKYLDLLIKDYKHGARN